MASDVPDPILVPPVVGAPLAPAVLPYRTPDTLQIPEGWTRVDTFHLDPAQLPSCLRFLILFNTGVALAILLLTSFIFMVFITALPPVPRWICCGLFVLFGLVGRTVRLVRELGKTRRLWPVYRVLVADQGVLQVRPGFANVQVAVSDVRAIRETWDGFWIIKRNGIRIIIPKRVAELHRLRERLAAIQPITRQRFSTPLRLAGAVAALTTHLGLMVYCLSVSDSPAAIGACLGVMIPLGIGLAWQSTRIANFSLRQRITNAVVFAFTLFIVAARLGYVLVFHP